MRRHGFFLVMGLVLAGVCRAQEAPPAGTDATVPAGSVVRIAGAVKTAEGVAVPGATVRVVETGSGKAWLSWTDEAGKFDFAELPAGHYRIEVEQLGFEAAVREADFSAVSAPPVELTIRVGTGEAPATNEAKNGAGHGVGRGASGAQGQPGQRQPPGGQGPGQHNGAVPPGVLNAVRQGLGGFQQVDVNGETSQGGQTQSQGQSQGNGANAELAVSNVPGGALGGAASSDAFLMSGTVGRGAAGGDSGFPMGGPGGPGMGGPGGPGGGAFSGQGGGGPGGSGGPGGAGGFGPMGGGGGPRGGGGGRGGPGGGQGVGGLWGAQRIMRQQVNRIRWSLNEQYENSAFDARPYSLTEANPAKISHYSENFGGGAGGPLNIPHVYDGKDKTFFFVNYQMGRQQSPVDSFATVPTLAERGQAPGEVGIADFCTAGPGGTAVKLYNPNLPIPLTGGCQFPSTAFDTAALKLLQFIPEPNVPGAGTVLNYHLQTTVPVDTDRVNLHVLHTINAKFNLNVGYNFSSTRQEGIQNFPQLLSNVSSRGQSATIGLNENISPRLLNAIQLNWNRSRSGTLNGFAYTNNILGAGTPTPLIQGVSPEAINYGLPLISLTNFTDWADPVPSLVRNQTWRLTDSVTYTRGKHSFQAGAEVRRIENNNNTDPTPRGQFAFTGRMTSELDSSGHPVAGTGFDFADFLLGLPDTTMSRFGSSSVYFRNWGFATYAQDSWHMSPKFTLDFGVRYEAFTPPVELDNHIANLLLNSEMTTATVVCPVETPTCAAAPTRSLIHGDYNNWAPRLGFAWKPKEKLPLVVRAGYGMYYNESIYGQLAAEMANQPPWAQAGTLVNTGQLTLQNGLPTQAQVASTLTNTVAVNPNYKVGYAQIWNLSVESQLNANWVLTVIYTGTKGTDLDMLLSPNRAPLSGGPPPIPNADVFNLDTSGASSIYHAMQVMLQHRFAHGLMFRGVYTYGKSIDDASSIGGGAPVVVQDENNIAAERGLSSFDIRHQFTGFWVYELPFGERKRWLRKGLGEHVLGNLRVNGVTTIQTGTPYTARVLGNDASCGGTGTSFSGRADQIGGANLPAYERTPFHWFYTTAFVVPPCGQYGDAARNTITGPGMANVNLGVSRGFRFGQEGRHRLDVRWDVRNLFNTANFTGLSTVVNSQTFGWVLGARAMRTMDVSLRWNW
jgi:trimeric autotransporter adhesin